ncbi:MAG: hypothetical protein H7Y20_18065 [Bryobacteraceae bacterium]|nr:hypothetical protein [Bryobacteraceae bacterium]
MRNASQTDQNAIAFEHADSQRDAEQASSPAPGLPARSLADTLPASQGTRGDHRGSNQYGDASSVTLTQAGPERVAAAGVAIGLP